MKKCLYFILFLLCSLNFCIEIEATLVKDLVFTTLDSRLEQLKKLPLDEQPLCIKKNPCLQAVDLIESVYCNNDPEALAALYAFFQQDSHPIFAREQLEQFLLNNAITASTWRNQTSSKCIITLDQTQQDAFLMSMQHELTHVLQHAEITCIGLKSYLERQFLLLEKRYPEAFEEFCTKYSDYAQNLINFDDLDKQEQYVVSQTLLEHWADIEACCLLRNHVETQMYIENRITHQRPKLYLSYKALRKIMQQL